MRTKIHSGVFLVETDRVFRVDSSYRNGFTRKRKSESVKKTGDVSKDLAALEIVKKSVIRHYIEMEYISAVGVIVQDKECSIRGMIFAGGRIIGSDKDRIEVKVLIQRRGMGSYSRSVSTYSRFVEIWDECSDWLVTFHGLEAKPQEWVEAPTELFFESLQEQLIDRKKKAYAKRQKA
jgi:hypothetical protein